MSSIKGKRGAHWDASGHLRRKFDATRQEHAEERAIDPNPLGFLLDARAAGSSGLQSGEQFLESATSAENGAQDAADQLVTEELGGPFVETSASTEVAKEEGGAEQADEAPPGDGVPET
ncbi:MAG TPA: hypothetical protein VK524_26455 [Polyangiaceae bacterium]|nr:hypothetical protein [Polyangiaceae bacterium]